MEQQAINIDQYPGEWLALEPGTLRVAGHSMVLREAEEEAHKNGVERPMMFSCPTAEHPCVGRGAILWREEK